MIRRPTHYETLGIGRDATTAQVKAAYRSLAKQHHPDVGGDEDDFKALNEAYEILANPSRRKSYDTAVGPPLNYEPQATGRPGGFAAGFVSRLGEDVHREVVLDFEQCFFGTRAPAPAWHVAECSRCRGTGRRAPHPGPCLKCGSTGKVLFGPAAGRDTCTSCQGSGSMLTTACEECGHTGRILVEEASEVPIPAGVSDGSTVRFPRRGRPSPAGDHPGDLYITVLLSDETTPFGRDGADVTLALPVTPAEATLGASVQIPLPGGRRAKVRVPAGTQPGRELLFRGRGAPRLDGAGRGNLRVQVGVVIATKVAGEEKAAYERLLSSEEPPSFGRLPRG